MTPRISVIVPCYNAAPYVGQAIESVLRQTHAAHELIVVDDGSTDRSAEVAGAYGSPVRVIRQENRGEAGARNTGAAAATGTHLLFLDADDLLTVDALERRYAAARQQPDAMILMRWLNFADDPERPTSEPSPLPGALFPDLIHTCIGVPHTWLTPMTVYRRTTGFTSKVNYFVDWEFWCRAALLNPPLVILPSVGALYRRHADTMSANTPPQKRVRGHVAVMQTLADGFLAQPHLLQNYGADLFWCSWTALDRARRAGMSWDELAPLVRAMAEVGRRGPDALRSTASVRLAELLGIRRAYWLRSRLTSRDAAAAPPQ